MVLCERGGAPDVDEQGGARPIEAVGEPELIPVGEPIDFLERADSSTSNDGLAIKELQRFTDQIIALPVTVIANVEARRLIKATSRAIFTINELQPC